MSRRQQQVLIAIQVHIQENGAPGPVAERQTTELGDLRVGAIAAVQLERVPPDFRTKIWIGEGQVPFLSDQVFAVAVSRLIVAVQHCSDKEFSVTATTYLREINLHGRHSLVEHCQPRNG